MLIRESPSEQALRLLMMGALLSRLLGGRNREEGQSRVNEQDRAVLVSARPGTQGVMGWELVTANLPTNMDIPWCTWGPPLARVCHTYTWAGPQSLSFPSAGPQDPEGQAAAVPEEGTHFTHLCLGMCVV